MSLNKAILIGNVGREPDIRYFDNGNAVANFTLATNERGYRLANGTEIPERTEWHNIVAGRDRAIFVERYVHKGSLVYVEERSAPAATTTPPATSATSPRSTPTASSSSPSAVARKTATVPPQQTPR